jgi:DNA-binding SARP family transcriptional activator
VYRVDEQGESVTESAVEPKFLVLGLARVRDGAGRLVSVGGPRPRALLCALVAEAGRVVSVDRLIDQVWAGDPPPAALGTLYAYMSQLRKVLDPDRDGSQTSGLISTTGSGYLLHAGPADVDASLFELLVERARTGPPAEALATLDRALALWRGEPYVDLSAWPDVAGLAQPLVEARLRAVELRIEALLELGRAGAAVTSARWLVDQQPLREPYWRRLMVACYRDGRQADALAAYARCRRVLDDELGMSPEQETEALHTAILRRDPGLRPPSSDRIAPPTKTASASATASASEIASGNGAPATESPAGNGARSAGPNRAGNGNGQRTRLEAPAPPLGLERLIGREPQLMTINESLRELDHGRGWLIVLEGEAGIGKTRLAEAGRDLAEAQGVQAVWSSAPRELAAPPLWPWEQVLRALGVATPGPRGPGEDAASARFRLCQQVADAVFDASRRRPLLVVLDDVQWADELSLQVLRLLAPQLNRHRCMVLATRRTGDPSANPAADSALAALHREHTVRRVPVPPLSVEQVAALVERSTPGGVADPVTLHRRTGGNLFYLIELLRFYAEPGASAAQVPASVQAVVGQRHDQLPRETRIVLRLAAIGGEQLDLPVLAQATDTDLASLVTALEPAQRSGLLRRDEHSLTWQFVHDIAREALVSRIGPAERARLHGVLAEAITQVHGARGPEHLDDLAQHLFHAAHGTSGEAAYLACAAAADQARAQLAPHRAARHRERALTVLPKDESPDRRLRTLLALSEEHGMAGDQGASTTAAAEVLVTARAAPDTHHETLLEATALLAGVTLWTWPLPAPVETLVISTLRALLATALTPAQRATVLGALAQRLDLANASRAEVERTADEAVRIARVLDDVPLLGRTLNNYVRAVWYPEREADRLAATEEALGLVGRELPAATEIFARMHRMPILLRHGRLAEYERELAVSGELARSINHPEAEAHATYHRITHQLVHGRTAGLNGTIQAAARDLARGGFSQAEFSWVVQAAGLARANGRLGEHAAELTQLAEEHIYGACLRPTAVLAHLEAGDPDTARRLVSQWGLRGVPEPTDWATDFVAAELGEVAARLGIPDPADLYRRLLPHRGTLSVLGTTMLCTGPVDLTLARLASRLGQQRHARQHLDEAAERYQQLAGFAHAFDAVRAAL